MLPRINFHQFPLPESLFWFRFGDYRGQCFKNRRYFRHLFIANIIFFNCKIPKKFPRDRLINWAFCNCDISIARISTVWNKTKAYVQFRDNTT